MSKKVSGSWVLEGDIKCCFDNISHEWLRTNIPMNKRILNQFLKAGFVYKKDLYPTKEGTPQGGIISPILANLTLNGLAEMLEKKYSANARGNISKRENSHRLHTIVYADDFIITANNEEILHQVKQDIEEFLLVRGLELSESKTLITHINDGFDFLGWNFRKFKTKLIIAPSKQSVKKICKKISGTVRKNLMQKQEILIKELNRVIRGWCNYHKSSCAKKAFQTVDRFTFYCLWRWVKRRHANKSNQWRKDRYFHREGSRDWTFRTENHKLIFASDIKIKRHVLIKFEAHPYLREYDVYYSKRRVAC
jgi:RNA-directed DNA polymerase